MDLFTYLLGKKGKNSLVHKGDLFAYLLGSKNQREVKTVSGTTINITDAINKKIESLLMTKESTQDGTPTPESPVEVKTVKGSIDVKVIGKNLFNQNDTYLKRNNNVSVSFNNNKITISNSVSTGNTGIAYFIPVEIGKSITISYSDISTESTNNRIQCAFYDEPLTELPNVGLGTAINTTDKYLTATVTKAYLMVLIRVDNSSSYVLTDLMVSYENDRVYELYKQRIVNIPLGNNEVAGIGDYKDELLVDNKGHCYINKKVGKVVLNGTESLRKASATDIDRFIWDIPEQQRLWIVDTNSLSNYFEYYTGNRIGSWRNNAGTQLVFNFSTGGTTTLNDFKTWLGTNNVVCYQPLVTPQLIDLNTTVDIKLFAGTNNISNSDNMYMVLKYY